MDLNNPPELIDQALTSSTPLISSSLLHNVILLEARSYSMKYAAKLKRNLLRKTEELNEIIESKIDSDDPEDMEIVNNLKEEVQKIEDKRDLAAARKYFTKVPLEGEKPSKFFCSMNKKRLEKAQFDELHIVERKNNGLDEIRVVKEQKAVDWEVRKYYCNLY